MAQRIYVTNPITDDADETIGEYGETALAVAAALKSGLQEAGYSDLSSFLSHDENWLNIEFTTHGGGIPERYIVRTIS